MRHGTHLPRLLREAIVEIVRHVRSRPPPWLVLHPIQVNVECSLSTSRPAARHARCAARQGATQRGSQRAVRHGRCRFAGSARGGRATWPLRVTQYERKVGGAKQRLRCACVLRTCHVNRVPVGGRHSSASAARHRRSKVSSARTLCCCSLLIRCASNDKVDALLQLLGQGARASAHGRLAHATRTSSDSSPSSSSSPAPAAVCFAPCKCCSTALLAAPANAA